MPSLTSNKDEPLKLVAVDTATEACSAALYCNGEISFRYTVEPRIHAKALLPMLDELLLEAGIKPLELDGIAFGRGPGAFTGVRIATAAAQAIALAADIETIPVSTLAAVARRCYREHGCTRVAVAIDARMNEVYWGAYDNVQDTPVLNGEEMVCSPSAVPVLDSSWIAAGTGWSSYAAELTHNLSDRRAEIEPFPHALDILSLGIEQFHRGNTVSADDAKPVYLRNDVAKTEAQRMQERQSKES
jgi:tRNA threonylcarbamoyladenosine biosynthesis protein TsaB